MTDAILHPRPIEAGSESIEQPRRAADPSRLLHRAGQQPASSPDDIGPRALRFPTGLSRRGLAALLARIGHGRLEIVEADGTVLTGGDVDAEPRARLHVHDERAWTAVAREGSIGLGRGYIEGWWSTDDPVAVVRVLIANLGLLDDWRGRIARVRNPLTDPLRRLVARRSRVRSTDREDIAAHYDIGNDFFSTFLDDTMTYSSGVFPDPLADLEAASTHKVDRLLDKLDVSAGRTLLEIGTGWGFLALRAARHHGASVVTTTISEEQAREARHRFEAAGVEDRVAVLQKDWRDVGGRFDRVVSVEMIEAVDWKDYRQFFRTIEQRLRPDGMAGIQAICVPGQRFEAAKHTEDYIRRFVFPGGMLPSVEVIARGFARHTRLQLLDVEDFSAHYAETLRRWRQRFDDASEELDRLGLDDRFRRLWRFYLAYCEAAFTERHCTVNQLVLVGPDWRPDGLALRPH